MEIINKRATKEYEIMEQLEAGIALSGGEVRAVKDGRADLIGSFVKIIGSEAYVVNAKIYPFQSQVEEGFDLKRTRKLLLHKKEIIALKTRMQGQGLAVVPLSMYVSENGLVKMRIALAKGLRKFDKNRKKR
jgi:SsrA-binding protein